MSHQAAEENTEKTTDEVEDKVTPWDVEAQADTGIDYDKLIRMSLLSIIYEVLQRLI